MIVPMKKVSLILLEKERDSALERLRETGVLHVERKRVNSAALTGLLDEQARLRRAINLLRRYPDPSKPSEAADSRTTDGKELLDRIFDMENERKILQEQMGHHIKEKRRIEGWGDFNPKDFAFLAENGLNLIPYEISPKVYETLFADKQNAETQVIVLSQDKRLVRLLALSTLSGQEPWELPALSLAELEGRIMDSRQILGEIEVDLAHLVVFRGALEKNLEELREKIEFETARAGMESLEEVPAESALNCTITWIKGFVPQENLGALKRAAMENNWALGWEDPGPEDRPPTLVRNGAAVRIIRPLFAFLGTVPGYWEYDISPSYLIFFCLFFAMIFGDAAYGVLLFAAALLGGLAFKIKSGRFPEAAKLFMVLAFCTVGWGAITGAWFGAPMGSLPPLLRSLILPPFNNTGPLASFPVVLQRFFNLPPEVPVDSLKTRWNIQFLCFSLGTFQLVWARSKNIKKLLPSLTAFAQAGWLVLMIGLYFLVLFMLLRVPMPAFTTWFIGGGIALYFIFAEQKGGNFFKNILKSFSNFLPTFLTAVGSFADVISYIRLFAVGLAGSSIAESFNSMAIPAGGFGEFGPAFVLKFAAALLILIFGHGLNIVMNALSVIVHGVRLNLLEYAGNHLGMEWSGYAYNPFAVRRKEKEQ